MNYWLLVVEARDARLGGHSGKARVERTDGREDLPGKH